jgi:rhamnulokinase
MKSFIAIDVGAGSGRIFLSDYHNGIVRINEAHRFPAKSVIKDGSLHWDFDFIINEIKSGLSGLLSKDISSIGVDTWGVDYGLLGGKGYLLENPYAYRDSRTNGISAKVFNIISESELYKLTGIQLMEINTIFQLYAAGINTPDILERAKDLLFIPDLINYFLTGNKRNEYTVASTSQLLNPYTKNWERDIFDKLNIPAGIMQEIVMPGNVIGSYKDINVVSVGSHDTASAIASIPATDDKFAYISSGTWSLMGLETYAPVINSETKKMNFTNEGGVFGTTRLLKNINGLWILEQCKKEWDKERKYSYSELMKMPNNIHYIKTVIEPDAQEFINPPCMIEAINNFCKMTNQQIPRSIPDYVFVILSSLALKYRYVLEQMIKLNVKDINRIHIVGGGSGNKVLCRFTANAAGLPVIAGPHEATIIGNTLMQCKAAGLVNNLSEMRKIVKDSFHLEQYYPEDSDLWNGKFDKFKEIKIKYNF